MNMIKSLINRLLCREIQNVETRIYDWLTAIDNKETVPSEITAFNIGIFEQDEGYSIYLTGSEEYDADGDDWACDVDFEPANKYLELSGPGIKAMEWQEFQDMIVKIVSDYLDTSANTSTSVFAGRVV
ncbi:hypothetical protein, partial [Xylanibacter rodentium]